MGERGRVFAAVFIFQAVAAADPGPAPLTFEAAAREALDKSPAVARAKAEAGLASLEEPALLAGTDPQFFGGYSVLSDRSPRQMPLFQGTSSRADVFQTGILERTLIGTEARLQWDNERLRNPSAARPLDPTADSMLSLKIRQPLMRYFWGRPDKARRGRDRALAAAAESRLLQVQTETVVAVGKAYLALCAAGEAARIQDQAVAEAEKLADSYREKGRQGVAEASDLAQVESLLEAQKIEASLARSDEDRARNALMTLLQRHGGAPLPPLAGLPDLKVPDPKDVDPAVAAARRPEVAAAKENEASAAWAERISRLDGLPDVSVTGSVGWGGLDRKFPAAWDDMTSGDHPVTSAGVSVTVPFFFKKEKLDRRSAHFRHEAAARESEGAVQRALEEAKTAAQALTAARERLRLRERLVDIEDRKRAAEEENFRRGRSGTDLLVRFRQDLFRARAALAAARAEEAGARLEWARSLGLLNDVLGGPAKT